MNFIQRVLITVSVGYVLLAIGLPAGSGDVVQTFSNAAHSLVTGINTYIEKQVSRRELDLLGGLVR
jgi:hypothetical protein